MTKLIHHYTKFWHQVKHWNGKIKIIMKYFSHYVLNISLSACQSLFSRGNYSIEETCAFNAGRFFLLILLRADGNPKIFKCIEKKMSNWLRKILIIRKWMVDLFQDERVSGNASVDNIWKSFSVTVIRFRTF